MNPIDVAILRYFGPPHRGSLGELYAPRAAAEIARSIGVDRTTVWRRISRMHRIGFVDGIVAFPHWRLLGYDWSLAEVNLDDPRNRGQVVRDLAHVDGVLSVEENFGTQLLLTVLAHSDAGRDRLGALLRRLPGILSVSPPRRLWYPEPTAPMTVSDWRIIRALQASPLPSPAAIGARLGLTSRTVARHLQRQIASGVLQIRRRINYAKYPGLSFGDFDIYLKRGDDWDPVRQRVKKLFPDYVWFPPRPLTLSPGTVADTPMVLAVPFDSPAEAAEAEQLIGALPGVVAAHGHLARRDHWFVDWFLERADRGVVPGRSSAA